MNIRSILSVLVAGCALLLNAETDLPAGYTKLTYIESAGTQYINTEYCHQAGDAFTCEYSARLDRQPAESAAFGVMTDAGTSRCIFWNRRASASVPSSQYGSSTTKAGTAGGFAYGRRMTVVCDDTSVRWTDTAGGSGSLDCGGALKSSGLPIYLFAYNRLNGAPTDLSVMRLYAFKVVDSSKTTVVDLVPCRNADGDVGLYDRARGRFLTNGGTGEFIGAGALPSGCRALEYIESTGTQYIDTGYCHSAGDTFACEFLVRLDKRSAARNAIFGVMTDGNAPRCIFWAQRSDVTGAGVPAIMYGSGNTVAGTAGTLANGKKVSLVCDDTSTRWTDEDQGGGSVSSGLALATSASPMYLFAYNRTGEAQASEFTPMRLYSFKVTDKYGESAVDMMPCRNAEGVVGLYDLARDKFLTNSGTGAFYAGGGTLPDGYESLEYIESTGTQYINMEYNHRTRDRFECEFLVRLGNLPAEHAVFGIMPSTGSPRCCFWTRRKNVAVAEVPVYMRGSTDNKSGKVGTFPYGKRVTVVCDDASARWIDAEGQEQSIACGNELSGYDAPMYIFAYNREFESGIPMNFTAMKLYSFKVVDRYETTVVDLTPSRNSEGVIGLYDLVRDKFLTNSGSGAFYPPGNSLPAGYMALDYIESTGTQYIDTGYCHAAGDVFECDFSSPLEGQPSTSSAIFGVMTSQFGPRSIFWSRRGAAQVPVYMHGSDASVAGEADSFAYGKRMTVTCDDTSARWIDEDGGSGSIAASGPISSSDQPLYLFAYNRVDASCPREFSVAKVYAFKSVNKTGATVVDLLPCCNPDGVVGLYDRVRKSFLGNAGSDEFIGGGVQAEVDGDVLKVSEGMLTSAVVADYDVIKVSNRTVNASAVLSYPGALTLSKGVYSLLNGQIESHAVSGALTLVGGVTLRLDLSKQECDSLSADSVTLTDADAQSPIVIAPRLLSTAISRSRVYRLIVGGSLTTADLPKFRLEGVEHGILDVIDGDLCLVNDLGPAGLILTVW